MRKGVVKMTMFLNFKGFEPYMVDACNVFGGVQYVFKFENHYGASVIKHPYSYGHEADLWELAVMKLNDKNGEWHLNYNTPITDDVIGELTDEEVRKLLKQIKEL